MVYVTYSKSLDIQVAKVAPGLLTVMSSSIYIAYFVELKEKEAFLELKQKEV
jgi:hypothetical protein